MRGSAVLVDSIGGSTSSCNPKDGTMWSKMLRDGVRGAGVIWPPLSFEFPPGYGCQFTLAEN